MTRNEADNTLNFLGTRENASANGCAQDWDDAWTAYWGADEPTHYDLAGRTFTV